MAGLIEAGTGPEGVERHGFAFREDPFDPLPNPKFAQGTTPHAHALNAVLSALRERDAVTIVTGDEGTGKTTLCLALPQHFEPGVLSCSVLSRPEDEERLLCDLLEDFGVGGGAGAPGARLADRYNALLGLLLSLAANGVRLVVVIDNADDLPRSAWDAVVRLTNFAANHAGMLQLVLVGRPRLDAILQDPALHLVSDRIVSRHQLEPFPGREVKGFIERRLWIARGGVASLMVDDRSTPGAPAAAARPRFTRGAVGVIASRSSGNPRVINELCGRALEIARAREEHRIGVTTALRAASQLGLRSGWLALITASPRIVAGAIVVLTTLFLSTWWVTGYERVPGTDMAAGEEAAASTSGTVSFEGDFQRFKADVLQRAAALSKASDVRGLLQLQEHVKQSGTTGNGVNRASAEGLLLELEGFADQARRQQLDRDRELILKHGSGNESRPPQTASK